MNALDWILLAVTALAAVRCLARGFVTELLSVAAAVPRVAAALLLYRQGALVVRDRLGIATLPEVIAFAAIFLVGFLLVKILAKILREGLEAANLAGLDRALGLVLGLLEGIVISALVLLAIDIQPLVDAKGLLEGSVFARTLLPLIGPGMDRAMAPAAEVLKTLPTGKK